MLENINLQQVYFWVSLVSTTLFLIKMVVFLIVGGDAEVETDFDSFADADPSFSFFSVQSILAFLMGCGWMGLAIIEKMKTNPLLAIVITLIVGFIFMTVTAFLMFSVKKLNHNVKVDLNHYVGTVGKAYNSIEANSEGQIEIVINKKLSIINATNLTGEKIDSFSPIRIEKVENNKVYIVKA